MPIFRIRGKICYFAHVPKCGGSSVEDYMRDRFGNIGLKDAQYMRHDQKMNWSKTSPQHIDWHSLRVILPPAFIDYAFTVVRHPVQRMLSAYNFQLTRELTVPQGMSFSEWLVEQVALAAHNPYHLDNRIRPQSDFVPEGAVVFHLEHGLDAIIPYLDGLAGDSDGPRVLSHVNQHSAKGGQGVTLADIGESGVALIRKHYAVDFERFGYDASSPKPLQAKPVLPEDYALARDGELRRRRKFTSQVALRLKRRFRRL